MIYRLVTKKGNSYKIGLRQYTKSEAKARQDELKKIGINMIVMEENKALGIQC